MWEWLKISSRVKRRHYCWYFCGYVGVSGMLGLSSGSGGRVSVWLTRGVFCLRFATALGHAQNELKQLRVTRQTRYTHLHVAALFFTHKTPETRKATIEKDIISIHWKPGFICVREKITRPCLLVLMLSIFFKDRKIPSPCIYE